MIGIFLAQAHLFDIDAIPEAIKLISRGRIDRLADLEAIAQWSIHDNSSRNCTCAHESRAPCRDPSVMQKPGLVWSSLICEEPGPSRAATSCRDGSQLALHGRDRRGPRHRIGSRLASLR